MASDDYGYFVIGKGSGEPIALTRPEACQVATMTLEAQERHERVSRGD